MTSSWNACVLPVSRAVDGVAGDDNFLALQRDRNLNLLFDDALGDFDFARLAHFLADVQLFLDQLHTQAIGLVHRLVVGARDVAPLRAFLVRTDVELRVEARSSLKVVVSDHASP
jgi:hypothetical protein